MPTAEMSRGRLLFALLCCLIQRGASQAVKLEASTNPVYSGTIFKITCLSNGYTNLRIADTSRRDNSIDCQLSPSSISRQGIFLGNDVISCNCSQTSLSILLQASPKWNLTFLCTATRPNSNSQSNELSLSIEVVKLDASTNPVYSGNIFKLTCIYNESTKLRIADTSQGYNSIDCQTSTSSISREGIFLGNNVISYNCSQTSLSILVRASPEWNLKFLCTAIQPNVISQSIELNLNIEVAPSPPEVQPADLLFNDGDVAVITCSSYNGSPEAEVNLTLKPSQANVTSISAVSVNISILCLIMSKELHDATVTCSVLNHNLPGMTTSRTVQVNHISSRLTNVSINHVSCTQKGSNITPIFVSEDFTRSETIIISSAVSSVVVIVAAVAITILCRRGFRKKRNSSKTAGKCEQSIHGFRDCEPDVSYVNLGPELQAKDATTADVESSSRGFYASIEDSTNSEDGRIYEHLQMN